MDLFESDIVRLSSSARPSDGAHPRADNALSAGPSDGQLSANARSVQGGTDEPLDESVPRSGVVVDTRAEESSRKGRRIRGAILIAVVVVGVVIWKAGASPADSHAEAVKRRVSSAVVAVGRERLALGAFNGALGELNRAAGTTVWLSAGKTLVVKADASRWWTFWQPRCVIVGLAQDGTVRSLIVKTPDCFRARVPAAWERS